MSQRRATNQGGRALSLRYVALAYEAAVYTCIGVQYYTCVCVCRLSSSWMHGKRSRADLRGIRLVSRSTPNRSGNIDQFTRFAQFPIPNRTIPTCGH